jgi:AcrR family transcriptional regulator
MAHRPDTPERPSGRAAAGRRWRRQPEARPQQILDAARRTFASKGYFGATLDDVAREAGITKGTIYLYYPNKQAVFSEMVRAYADEIVGELRADLAAGRPLPARELIRRLSTQLLRVFRRAEYQAMVRLILGEAGRFPDEMETLYREVIVKRIEEVGRFFETAMDRGEIRRMDPILLARTLQGMALGFAIVQESLRGGVVHPWPESAIADAFATVLWEGLRP